MTRRAQSVRSRADFREAAGVLLVVRDPPPQLPELPGQPPMVAGDPAERVVVLPAVWSDGSVTGLSGHVDFGTGLRTALAQVVAEELDVAFGEVHLVLGDTACAPKLGHDHRQRIDPGPRRRAARGRIIGACLAARAGTDAARSARGGAVHE